MRLAAVIADTRYSWDLYKDILAGHRKYLPDDTPFLVAKNFDASIEGYNNLLTSVGFWDDFIDFGLDRILIFQHDSMLLRKGIEKFCEYDYVGAPFPFQLHGGNGGLSLRNPKIMKQICEQYPYIGGGVHGNEDVYFSNIMHDKKIGNLAPRYVCEKFSVETEYKLGSLGYHAIDKYLTPEQCEQIKNQYNG